MSDNIQCPNCKSWDLTAVTYAYHAIKADEGYGPQLEHTDWSDEYALVCYSCNWTHGDPARPDRTDSLQELTDPKLQELREFEAELAKQAQS